MSELSPPTEDSRLFRIFGAAALAFGILASGVAAKVTYEIFKSPPLTAAAPTPSVDKPLRPCYDTPIKHAIATGVTQTKPPLKIRQNSQGVVEGDPGMLQKNIREKLLGATVRIELPKSTGFLLESDLVVTSAHGVYTKNIGTIMLSDAANKLGKVIDGCYIYEKNGKLADPLDHKGADIDVAVLRLAEPLGNSTLSLANTELKPGEWATFFNYQHSRPIEDPAEYNGVVLADKPEIAGNILLTGVQAWRNCESASDERSTCAIEAGSSDGPVVQWSTGDVVGMSVRGTDKGRLKDADMLGHGVIPQFDTGPGTGHQPRIAYTTGTNAIEAAVKALG